LYHLRQSITFSIADLLHHILSTVIVTQSLSSLSVLTLIVELIINELSFSFIYKERYHG